MDRDLSDASSFSTFLTINAGDTNDVGKIELKFRANASWDTNWGGDAFPSGTGTAGGANIVVPEAGTYQITFNCTTLAYNFTKTTGSIGLVGTINGWGGAGEDYNLTRSTADISQWYGYFTINAADTGDNGKIEVKFRENQQWAVNWGSADGFPSGTGVQDGPNLVVPAGNYKVTFNTATGAYAFITTAGNVSMIGEFNGWSGDHWMDRDMTDPDKFKTIISFTSEQAGAGNNIVEAKFRENAAWAINWGDAAFPEGVGTNNGPNIPVLIDTAATNLTTDFMVEFEYTQVSGTVSTGTYKFTPASGTISMIGAFNGWSGDFPMNRDANNPNLWTATRSFTEADVNDNGKVEVKFRENADWTVNWGGTTFPSGTGIPGGANIPLDPGSYDITFNAATAEYSFTPNTEVVGEIGMVGDFNEWGVAGSDIYLIRDAKYPNYFTLTHNFSGSTGILFREDADPNFTNIWGGTFPVGTGVQDAEQIINVPGGKYFITFDANSGDFSFTQLGNSAKAPKVFALNIDGHTNEADWAIEKPVSKVVDGDAGDAMASAYFGAAYNDEFFYVGLEVAGATTADAEIDFFIDGDKSGGAYDAHDAHIKIKGDGTVSVVKGATGMAPVGKIVSVSDTSYSVELAVKWADLDVTAEVGSQVGFDMVISKGTAYKMAWNGGMESYDDLSLAGSVVLGPLSCGYISLYNEIIGDVTLRNTVDAPTAYLASYNLESDGGVVFRKDRSNTVTWGANAFPEGTATVGGPQIPATAKRYRVSFDCISGAYTFTEIPAAEASTSYSKYTETEEVIDGDLSSYDLAYGSAIVAAGTGPNNNTVTWGTKWDEKNLYIGAKVVDAVVEGSGNPWDNDAIEMYFDGDNSKDGAYSGQFDTQLIMDFFSNTADGSTGDDELWVKADGVPVTNFNSKWVATSNGYAVEVRLGWDNFGFAPGRGRIMGFSLGNNDSDKGAGRDYQTVWYGTDANWNNTALLGDLQLAEGPYFFVGIKENSMVANLNFDLYPNPANDVINIRTADNQISGNTQIMIVDITGKVVLMENVNLTGSDNVVELNVANLTKGIYLVNILGQNGARAAQKLIVQ